MALPLAVQARKGFGMAPTVIERTKKMTSRKPSVGTVLAASLALAGGLALRFLSTHEGYRSAKVPADTWKTTGGHGFERRRIARPRARARAVTATSSG